MFLIKISKLSTNNLNKNLFEELKLLPLPDDKKVELLNKAAELVETRFALRIARLFADPDYQKLAEFDAEKSIELLNDQVPDWPKFLEEEILRVRKEMAEFVYNDPEINS